MGVLVQKRELDEAPRVSLIRVSVVINLLDTFPDSGNQRNLTSAQHAVFILENSFRLQAVIITNVLCLGGHFFLKGPRVGHRAWVDC